MDWEKVQKTLKKRNFDTFGAVIEDLRLIFTNAYKYNSRLAGTNSVSGRAYDSAKIMSAKLEIAINKLMVTVSDRVERERIDHNNAEREIEAAERVEAARIRAQWNSEGAAPEEGGKSGGPVDGNGNPQKVEGSLRVRNSSRRANRHSQDTDFEVPFFEEDFADGQHEESYVEVMKQQKATFERQREELVAMRKSTKTIGLGILKRRMMSGLASKWIEDEQKRLGLTSILSPAESTSSSASATSPKSSASADSSGGSALGAKTSSRDLPSIPSEVSSKLEEKDRVPVKIKLIVKSSMHRAKQQKKKARKRINIDWGDDDDD
jgi:hypothetical protein